MKKTIMFTLIVMMFFMLSIPSSSVGETEASDTYTVLDVIRNQMDIDPADPLFDVSLYRESLLDYLGDSRVKDFITMRIYHTVVYHIAAEDLEYLEMQARNEADQSNYHAFISFAQDPIQICHYAPRGTQRVILDKVYTENPAYDNFYVEIPTYISDIINSTYTNDAASPQHDPLKKVVCFVGDNMYLGTVIYYVGEMHTEVWYYATPRSQAVKLSLSEFQDYGPRYNQYLVENANDENGSPLGGISISLQEWINLYGEEEKDEDANPIVPPEGEEEEGNQNIPPKQDENQIPPSSTADQPVSPSANSNKKPDSPTWLVPTVVGLLIVFIGGTAIVLWFKKHKK